MRLRKTSTPNSLEITCLVVTLATMLCVSTFQVHLARAAITHKVKIADFSFIPQDIIIVLGDTIVWNNTDQVIHTLWFVNVTDNSTYTLSDPIMPNTTWDFTFNDTVSLQYFDLNRLWITGSIIVQTKYFPWDVTGDGYVGIDDIVAVAEHFGQDPGHPQWDPKYDINSDNYVGIDDIVATAEHFGELDP